MKIDSAQVSGKQFMFTLAFFLQASALLTSFLAGIAKNEAWISVVIGLVLCIPLFLLYRAMMLMFPDLNYMQVLCLAYGRVAGKVLGVMYVWFFLTLTAANVMDLGDFSKITFTNETPNIVPILICMFIAVWAVRNGFNVVSRFSKTFTLIEFFIVGMSIAFLANQMDLSDLLPVFTIPLVKYVQSVHIFLTIPCGELVIFLMITPCVKKMTPKEATKYWFGGVAMGMSVVLAVLVRDISLLGNALDMFTLPGLVTMRLVNLGEALSRMEVIFAVALVMLLFFKITVLCYVTTITVAQLFETTQFKHLATIVGLLLIAYAPTLYPSSVEHSLSARTGAPFIWTLFEILLPLSTFIVAKVRKLPQKTAAAIKTQEA
ncbi:MAG TPA: endospore germination permease [Terriglobales bacterium]|nr:endospore germination permease [Terriglobales bacterium]